MSEMTLSVETNLEQQFPELVMPDVRKGYTGYMVKPENLVELAKILRDELGYDFLSSATAVDYYTDDIL